MDRIEKIKELLKQSGVTTREALHLLENEREKERKAEIIREIERNGALVGKCFKGKCILAGLWREENNETYYYKVVSNRADSEDAVECLVFPSTPIITFTHNRHLHWQVTDGILGTYRYEGIAEESIAADSIARYLLEITNEEYEEAARNHLEQVLKADWRDAIDPRIEEWSVNI